MYPLRWYAGLKSAWKKEEQARQQRDALVLLFLKEAFLKLKQVTINIS